MRVLDAETGEDLTDLRAAVRPAHSLQQRTRGRKWMAIRARVLMHNPLCVECAKHGRVRAATQVDHIKPLHKGGTDDDDNLQGLCDACHAEKTARDAGHTVRREIGLDGWPVEP